MDVSCVIVIISQWLSLHDCLQTETTIFTRAKFDVLTIGRLVLFFIILFDIAL